MYVPKRNDICVLDFEPTKGKEIGKMRPALILSDESYNLSGMAIICPISTSIRGNLTEVEINNLESPSVAAASLVLTLDWKHRKLRFITKAEKGVLDEILIKLIPLLGGEHLIN